MDRNQTATINPSMENLWSLLLLAILFSLAVKLLLPRSNRRRLPPGPAVFPLIGNLLWLRNSITNLQPIIRSIHLRYGPVFTLHIGSRPTIVVPDHAYAHKLLVQHGAVFANRLRGMPRYNRLNISNSQYGPLWRLLRRNLASELLNPSRIRVFTKGRKWVLRVLTEKIRSQAEEGGGVVVPIGALQYATFCLLVFMCLGEKLEEEKVREIESVQVDSLMYFTKLRAFAFFPRIARLMFFSEKWRRLFNTRHRQLEIFLPMINRRRGKKQRDHHEEEEEEEEEKSTRFPYCYIDSLLDLSLPEENGRKLTDEEVVGLCSEFLNAGTETTYSALQWIMANITKHQKVQSMLLAEIQTVVGPDNDIEEEDLQRMPYLKAVIKEGLRRNPPGHLALPHTVTEDIEIDGYVFEKGILINFPVKEMGLDGKIWVDPLEFRPERFVAGGEAEGVDITGSREIKMMPFGVGRRICPGLGLAMLHLEYFVANLVKIFEWKPVEGEEIDMSEEWQSFFTVVMKNPLRARVSVRV